MITTPDLWGTLLRSAAMLSMVLAVLLGVLCLMRRLFYGRKGSLDRGAIRMLGSCFVAPKERILLIEVLGEKILVGVTPHTITRLAKIESDQQIDGVEDGEPKRFFSTLIRGAMERGIRSESARHHGENR